MADAKLSPRERAVVVAFADRHGPTQAARRYRVPLGSVKAWQVRAHRRAAKAKAWRDAAQADGRRLPDAPARPVPATDELELARRMAAGLCLRCGGQGMVDIGAVTRGTLVIRRARRMRCPNCGGVPRRIEVTEWPARQWADAMRRAGDLGAGWTGEEWQRLHETGAAPDGSQYTRHDRLEPGQP